MADQPPIERAVAKLLKLAEQVGLSGNDLIEMLNAGASADEILKTLGERAKGRAQD
jgi:hypothetical protein